MLENETLTDEEAIMAQSFISEEADAVPTSSQFSSARDLYCSVAYTDLTDEMKLVTDLKCFAYIGQLLLLVGKKCRVTGCGQDIDVSFHTNCGYGVKLSWTCKIQHRYEWAYCM